MKTIKHAIITVLFLSSLVISSTVSAATDNEPPEVLNMTLSSTKIAYQGNSVPGFVNISLETNEPTRGYILAVRDDGVQAKINLSTTDFKTTHSVNWVPWDDEKKAPLPAGTYRLKTYLNDAAYNSAQGFPVGQLVIVNETNPKSLVTVNSISTTTISPKYGVNEALTKVTYELSRPTEVQIAIKRNNETVYQTTKTKQDAGIQSFEWNGKSTKGALLSDGEYDVVFKTIETAYNYPSTSQTIQKLGNITINNGDTSIPMSKLEEIVSNATFETETLESGTSISASITTKEVANIRVYIATELGTHMNIVYAPTTELQPGTHTFSWDGKDMMGSKALNGKYFIKVSVADSTGSSGYITVGNPVTVTGGKTIVPLQPEKQVRVTAAKTGLQAYPNSQGAEVYQGDVLSLVALEPTDGYYSVLLKGVPAKVKVADVEMINTEATPSVPVEAPTTTNYTVVSGDTLWKIASKNATTINTLVNTNNLDVTIPLNIGQVLQVPKLVDNEPTPEQVTYVVQPGDTLWKIAQKYNVTVNNLLEVNRLTSSDYLSIGQKLVIPTQVSTVPEPNQTIYVVQPGDTLWKIALKYGVTVTELQSENNLNATSYLSVGQSLTIPTKMEQPYSTYTVVAGDTLWKIANAHKVTVQQLVDWNQLDLAKPIDIGQTLRVN
ncbi:LysM peptidoglycan-binding domain-containing protein [Aquibacillus salsiterrae]|uniref:LysM peptidoglycan-binding domain-containing protein n=1 Tax=Aquibacillus salsiterrae TaxID=2950439 RepID=A0A9X4ADG4_9BACI|nr:LysM peptidoglycan-binding domain-containing protein [Aquibacillus salsiterrae]MDC3415301.1 LysM peptidoglycan-binding domain-containing protein [Aquibacillus salsiterrae]